VIDALDGSPTQRIRRALPGGIEEDRPRPVVSPQWWVNQVGRLEKDSHTMPAMEKELRAKLLFPRLGRPMLFTSASAAQAGGRVHLCPWPLLAGEAAPASGRPLSPTVL